MCSAECHSSLCWLLTFLDALKSIDWVPERPCDLSKNFSSTISKRYLGTGIRGLMRGMATLPQGNQELLVVGDKVGRAPGELGVSKSMECDIFPLVLFMTRKILSILTAIFRWTWVSCLLNLFIETKDDGSGGDNWSYKSCKTPVRSLPPTNQHPVFTGQMPFLSPNQQCQITETKESFDIVESFFIPERLYNVRRFFWGDFTGNGLPWSALDNWSGKQM